MELENKDASSVNFDCSSIVGADDTKKNTNEKNSVRLLSFLNNLLKEY
jgi:hypothetical protein